MGFARYAVVSVLAVAAAACHLDLADAATVKRATLQGNEQNCLSLAYTFGNIAIYRDMGMSWADAKPQLEAAIQESLRSPDGLAKDADDARFVMLLAHSVWNGALSQVQAGEIGPHVYNECMGVGRKQT